MVANSGYTYWMKMTYCIKGKKPVGAIIVFNGVFKIAVSVGAIMIAASLYKDLQQISLRQINLENWTSASNYGVFYPVRSGDDTVEIREGKYPLDIPCYELYPF